MNLEKVVFHNQEDRKNFVQITEWFQIDSSPYHIHYELIHDKYYKLLPTEQGLEHIRPREHFVFTKCIDGRYACFEFAQHKEIIQLYLKDKHLNYKLRYNKYKELNTSSNTYFVGNHNYKFDDHKLKSYFVLASEYKKTEEYKHLSLIEDIIK